MVYELDDQFDSYSDAATLASMQYEMHLSERGQKVESVQRMTATGKEPAAPGAAQTRVWSWRALFGFQQLDAGGGEGQDGFEYDWYVRCVVREVQREGGVFFLDAVFEDTNGDF